MYNQLPSVGIVHYTFGYDTIFTRYISSILGAKKKHINALGISSW